MKKILIIKILIICVFLISCSKQVILPVTPSIVSEIDNINSIENGRQAARLSRILRDVNFSLRPLVYESSRLDSFVFEDHIRITSALMSILRNDEIKAVIINQYAHQRLGHYAARVGNPSEIIFNSRFTEDEISKADAFTFEYFAQNSLSLQTVVNAAYKFAKIYEDKTVKGKDIDFSPRLINNSSRQRARLNASMLEEYKLNQNYFTSILGFEDLAPIVKQRTETVQGNTVQSNAEQAKAQQVAINRKAIQKNPVAIKAPKKVLSAQEQVVGEVKTASLKFNKGNAVNSSAVSAPAIRNNPVAKVTQQSNSFRVTPGWYLQVSAENDLESAKNRVEILERDNLNCVIQDIRTNAETFYRVLVGPYSNELTAKSKAKQSSIIGADSFTRYVEH